MPLDDSLNKKQYFERLLANEYQTISDTMHGNEESYNHDTQDVLLTDKPSEKRSSRQLKSPIRSTPHSSIEEDSNIQWDSPPHSAYSVEKKDGNEKNVLPVLTVFAEDAIPPVSGKETAWRGRSADPAQQISPSRPPKKLMKAHRQAQQLAEAQQRVSIQQDILRSPVRVKPPKILNGFAILRASGVELPDEAIRANLSDSNYSDVETNDLVFFSNLKFMDVSHNRVHLEALGMLPALRELIATGNSLHHIEFNAWNNPQGMQLSQSLPPEPFGMLEILDLSFNRMSLDGIAALAPLPFLRILNLASNHLRRIPQSSVMAQFVSLERLDLSDNLLADPANLSQNALSKGISHTQEHVLTSLSCVPRLQHLNLSKNSLATIPELIPIGWLDDDDDTPQTLPAFACLRSLDLSYNLFADNESLVTVLAAAPRLEHINIVGTPLATPGDLNKTKTPKKPRNSSSTPIGNVLHVKRPTLHTEIYDNSDDEENELNNQKSAPKLYHASSQLYRQKIQDQISHVNDTLSVVLHQGSHSVLEKATASQAHQFQPIARNVIIQVYPSLNNRNMNSAKNKQSKNIQENGRTETQTQQYNAVPSKKYQSPDTVPMDTEFLNSIIELGKKACLHSNVDYADLQNNQTSATQNSPVNHTSASKTETSSQVPLSLLQEASRIGRPEGNQSRITMGRSQAYIPKARLPQASAPSVRNPKDRKDIRTHANTSRPLINQRKLKAAPNMKGSQSTANLVQSLRNLLATPMT